MQSKAKTVKEYLAELPPDRREALNVVRKVFEKNIDKTYKEGVGYGMIGYSVPHSVFPPGYHCDPKQPLPFAGMASQKNYMSVYLMCIYGHTGEDMAFRKAWAKTGKKLDMGKCCIRFKKVEDLALDVIGDTLKNMPAKKYIDFYVKSLADRGLDEWGKKIGGSAKPASKKSTSKSTPSTPKKKRGKVVSKKSPTARA